MADPVSRYLLDPTFGPAYRPRPKREKPYQKRIATERPHGWKPSKPVRGSRVPLNTLSPSDQRRALALGWGKQNFGRMIILLAADRLFSEGREGEMTRCLRSLIYGGCGIAICHGLEHEELPRQRVQVPPWLVNVERAAMLSCPKAVYYVGMWLDLGEEGYERDPAAAFRCFERAAAMGHAHSEWLCGVAYLYGTDFSTKDEVRGLQLIAASARKRFYGAVRMEAEFYDQAKFGYAHDPERAAALRALLDDDSVIVHYT